MILEIQHETTIGYAEPVSEWLCELRMEPVSDAAQRCHSFRISLSDCGSRAGQLDAACSRRGHDEQTMTPGGTHVPMHAYVDGFGNRVHHFNMLRPPALVRILAASVVETDHGGAGPMASQATFSATTPGPEWDVPLEALDYLPLRGPVRHTPLLDPVLVQLRPVPWMRVGMWVCQVAEWIRGRFEYARDVTDATSPIDHLLGHGKGVCQDFTHLMIAVLRSFGVPARYVSGYIHRENRDSQSHAWCEVWLPDIGWIGFDPTNGCPVNDHFVKTAVGRDYTDVPPNKGTYRGGGAETINVRVATRTLHRLPSISWHEQLAPLDAPAHAVLRTMPDWTHDAAVAQQ